MLEIMDDSSDRVLGLQVQGRITREVLDQAAARFSTILSRHGAVRLLVRIDEVPGFDLDALVERLRFGVRHARDIERVAVVTDSQMIERYVRVARRLAPRTEIHHFAGHELDTAWRWLASDAPSLTAVP